MEFEPIQASGHPLCFKVLGRCVRIDCADSALRGVLATNYAAMDELKEDVRSDLHYHVGRSSQSPGFVLSRPGESAQIANDAGDLLFLLEKDLVVALQRKRPDLLFLHSAALDWRGKACLLAGESGAGKSTTAWALLHHDFRYLSDELSPIDVDTLQVQAYPHALCLKQPPATPYALPGDVLHLRRTIHVPTGAMPGSVVREARPLAALFLLKYSPERREPTLRAMQAAEASAHLYVNALNALAHSNRGLDAVVRIAEGLPCFAVAAADLPSTCALIRSAMEQIGCASGSRLRREPAHSAESRARLRRPPRAPRPRRSRRGDSAAR
jgi:hypothetical protein